MKYNSKLIIENDRNKSKNIKNKNKLKNENKLKQKKVLAIKTKL